LHVEVGVSSKKQKKLEFFLVFHPKIKNTLEFLCFLDEKQKVP
jgi:hypothetical protein